MQLGLGYGFATMPGDAKLAVIDTRPTVLSASGQPVANDHFNGLTAEIPIGVGAFPRYVAATHDNTRAYVVSLIDGVGKLVDVDAVALQAAGRYLLATRRSPDSRLSSISPINSRMCRTNQRA